MKSLSELLNTMINPWLLLDEDTLDYVVEAKDQKEETKHHRHFDHVEDLLIRNKGEHFSDMLDALNSTHDFLSGGRKRPNYSISLKMDGSPAVVFGKDPKTGKFFVGTKSFFNKTPKVNFSEKDIDANHGSTTILSKQLKNAFHHLKKVVPKEGVFQGDLMYTAPEVVDYDGRLQFTPNTITYNVDKNSSEGKKILKSKIGIAPHTEYEDGDDGNLHGKFGLDLGRFTKSEDVHLFDTKVKGPFKYDNNSKKAFLDHIGKATEQYKKLQDKGAYEHFKTHEKLLLGYINDTIKSKREVSVEGYIGYVNRQHGRHIEKVKQDKTKDTIRQQMNQELQNIVANKSDFNSLFAAHKHAQKAKNVLVDALSQNSPYNETILGSKSKPEGFVVSHKGKPVKFVDRKHFSAENFAWNEKANPEDNPTVMHWGRFNPVTKGHHKMLQKGADIARRTGAKQLTVATNTPKNKDNPLTPQQKLQWIKTLFPGQDVALAGKEAHTIVAQLQQLHHKGVRDVTIVAGADRVPEYTRILAKYNGPEKLFHFKKARVVSSGERDPDSEGSEGVSATKVRKAVADNDFSRFRLGMPAGMKEKDASELFKMLRTALKEKPKAKKK